MKERNNSGTAVSPTGGSISPVEWIVFGIMCSILGTTFLAIKIGANAGIPPFLAAGVRFSLAGLILVALRGGIFSSRSRPRLSYLWRAAVLGVLVIGVTFAATYTAADYIGSGHIAQIQAVSPIMVALFSLLILKSRLTRFHSLGLLLGFLGAVMLIGKAGALGPAFFLGALSAFAAEISYSLGSIWYRAAFKEAPDPLRTNGFSMLTGGLVLLVLAVATGQTTMPWNGQVALSLGYLILFGSIGAHSMYLWLVYRVSPVFASTWLFISPVIATGLGALVLQESVTLANLIGGLAVLVGVSFIQRGERRRA
jgi:drug/metabolite transporter (DMT)-like permease